MSKSQRTVRPRYGERVDAFITKAESYLGYQARPNRNNIFGETVGYNNQPWDGAFVDVVAREVGVPLHSHVYTPQALSGYIGSGFFHVVPKRGDVVFFETSTEDLFGQPHIGIVTDASRWKTEGLIQTVEANVSSGLPRGNDFPDGVYRRTRSNFEVLGFGRPDFKKTASHKDVSNMQTVPLPNIVPAQIRPGQKHPNVELVQFALAELTGVRGLKRGTFDGKSRLAFAKFQRSIGVVDASGVPDLSSLKRLGLDSGLFTASE